MNDFREYGWEDEISEEGGAYPLLPEGDYDFTVVKIERGRHEGSEKIPPCNKAIVTFSVWGAEDKIEITENYLLCNKLEWKLSEFFLSVGLKKHGEPLKMNWGKAVGAKGKCHVIRNSYKKKDGSDGQSNKIKKLYAYDEQVRTVKPLNQQPASGGFGSYNGGFGFGGGSR
ncbi:DUF669 domain-containing protein [Ruminococcus sp. Marseille-P6503]|uniref:DUF669 domain-containing protein n=1 Tax=Ruminococcus sp. Marseille-P6503 TaxID=2364796 RepID=UPI000F54335B|nr:DUF669 domain-containing protein [Ruminococcus sp. Marseille-P6503]